MGCSAGAEIYLFTGVGRYRFLGLLRRRGDLPADASVIKGYYEAAPQARRSTGKGQGRQRPGPACSAGAEIYPSSLCHSVRPLRLLRRRGDLPSECHLPSGNNAAAPQARRSTHVMLHDTRVLVGCSAGAEIYLRYNGPALPCHRLLRRRGDLPYKFQFIVLL